MASPLQPSPRPHRPTRRSRPRRTVGILLAAAVPASAAPATPATAAEAAELVAARGHELEVMSEQFNEARELLGPAGRGRGRAGGARPRHGRARAVAAEVRGIARTAYTGEGLGSFQALMTSDSADEFVDRIVHAAAGRRAPERASSRRAAVANVGRRAGAGHRAAGRRRGAGASTTPSPRSRPTSQAEIAEYQAVFDQLSAQEQRAAVAGHAGDGPRQPVERARERRPPPAAPVVANSGAAQIAIDTAMAQRGKPYVWAAARAGLLRLLRPDRLRLRGRRHQPAALQPHAVADGPGGLPRPAAARRPGLLLQPGQPRRASTSATGRWCTRRPPATSSRWPRSMSGFSGGPPDRADLSSR